MNIFDDRSIKTQPTKTEAIKAFLLNSTKLDLAELYSHDMECQVNVAQDHGERIDGDFKGRQWHGFTDGISTWKPIRIPYNAATEPSFDDTPMMFDLAKHAEGIGMTGWNWVKKESIYVGFDFDAISGHSDQHSGKLTDKELKEVQSRATDIPWVTVRRSTSGNGLHLYVFTGGIKTVNHTEHAALGRSILGMMSAKVGFDFHSKVDTCGGNMWIWHRKMRGTPGLELIKKGTILTNIPPNWRDHVPIIKGTRRKTLPLIVEKSDINDLEKLFDDITSRRNNIPLDNEHRQLLNWLESNGAVAWWDQDRHMLVTHTYYLKQAHEELSLRGVFRTISQGTEQGNDHNCYCFPQRKGAWALRRFTLGVQEDPSWEQDGSGWTQCFYNKEPDLPTASKTNEGIEDETGSYIFTHAQQAIDTARLLGVDIKIPPWANGRQTKLKEHKDGRLIVKIKHDDNDAMAGGIPGWNLTKGFWTKIFNTNLRQPTEVEVGDYDDIVRHIVSITGDDCGWTLKSKDSWVAEPFQHIKVALSGALNLTPKEVIAIMGSSVFRHWRLVNMPFQPEYPGDRQWNREAAQFVYHPTENRDNLRYTHWFNLLRHCGAGLDDAVKENGWCKTNGILTGGDYLKVWIASLFQYPMAPLPYLFFYSQEQNTGKSTFHEALTELITGGVERADNALTNQQGFNGELASSILCVIEETDLSRSKVAYNRIKDWVTARSLPVHPKGGTPYTIPNSTHWVQTANDHHYCPVFSGDTRITMIHVSPLEPHQLIPKSKLLDLLKKEAPDFMAEILSLEIPPSNDRLNVPVIITSEKISAQKSNQTRLEAFIHEMCYNITGKMIKLSEFVEAFHEWLDPNDIAEWSKTKVGRELPPHLPKGRRPKDGQFYIGNISWEPRKPGEEILPKLILNAHTEMLTPVPQ